MDLPQLTAEQARFRRERRILAAVLAGLLVTTALASPLAFGDLPLLLLLVSPFALSLILTVLIAPFSVSAASARAERDQKRALRTVREAAAAQHAIRTPRLQTLPQDDPLALAEAASTAATHGIHFGCTHLRDEDFLQAFHACEIQAAQFRHGDHLRYTVLMLQRVPPGLVHETVARHLRTFLRQVCGSEALFHATRTHAWIAVLQGCRKRSLHAGFAALLQQHAASLRADSLGQFYSGSLLDGDEARQNFVAPDLAPLPVPYAPMRSNT